MTDASTRPPADEYRDRLAARQAALDRLARVEALFSRTRLGTFGAAVLLGVFAWRGLVSPYFLIAPGVVFLALVVRHDRVIRTIATLRRSIAFYERGLARLEDRWAGGGETGVRFIDDSHLYARDLDVFGRGSLFELLSIARTAAGEQILAGWLTTPGSREEVLARQDAVRELTPALDLREDLAGAGANVRTGVDSEALIAWAEGPPVLAPAFLRVAGVMTTAGIIVASVAWMRGAPFLVFLAAAALQGVLSAVQRTGVDFVLHSSDLPARELGVLLQVLRRLERERFSSPRLTEALRELHSGAVPSSKAIAALHRLLEMHDWQHNMVFAPVAALLMWDTHIAWAIQGWRLTHGRNVRRWVNAAGQFEAFSSLAAYRYEHPSDPFPEILPNAHSLSDPQSPTPDPGSHAPDPRSPVPDPQFAGTALGHPLIPGAQMVVNSVALTGDVALLIVSGSNMSGKSTLLRTVGINVVLALAGAPVRAASLRLTPVTMGATLRIQDSLQEGRSRFYAEITRISELAAVAGRGQPLLFLLDELFHGTNSHDRLVGALGVLRSLLDRGAIGLITTHDLALTAAADTLAPRAANVHFDDWFDGREIRFDYQMKPGPVTRSNAVALMRAVGLDVPSP